MNLETPQAALESLEQAAIARDWDGFTACVAPKYAGCYARILAANEPLRTAADRVLAAAEKQYSAEQVQPLRQEMSMIDVPTPLACAVIDGKVDWDQVSVTVDGETASVEIDDYPVAVVQRIEGLWHVTPHDVVNEEPAALDAQTEGMAEGREAMTASFTDIASRIAGGGLSFEDLAAEFG